MQVGAGDFLFDLGNLRDDKGSWQERWLFFTTLGARKHEFNVAQSVRHSIA